MTSSGTGSIKAGVAAGVKEETSIVLPPLAAPAGVCKWRKNEEAERSDDGWKSSQCLAFPVGVTSDPLKRSANIFQHLRQGINTAVDSACLTPE